ncbi:MAG: SpoIIE family protein phosphatase [Candidatus Wallbacteria bacterium]|nr:SpoIIE family protein phosphatase [Candidatus Wallbacteria bacterium]
MKKEKTKNTVSGSPTKVSSRGSHLITSLNLAGKRINSSMAGEELIENILESVKVVMRTSAAALFIRNADKSGYNGHFDFGNRTNRVIRKAGDCGDDAFVATGAAHGIVIGETRQFCREGSATDLINEFNCGDTAAACAPLFFRDQLLGAVLAMGPEQGTFSEGDLELLSAIANQSAAAISSSVADNKPKEAKRADQEQIMARLVQDGFFPLLQDVKWGYCEIGAQKEAAFNVSGDFYDFFPVEESTYFYLFGDVSGKGVPAAMMMAYLLSRVRYLVFRHKNLSRIVFELNNEIHNMSRRGMFVTMHCGFLDLNRKWLSNINSGHCPVLFHDHSLNTWSMLEGSRNIPLGIIEGFNFSEDSRTFNTGDILLMVSDGVFEARNHEGEEFSLSRLIGELPREGDFSAQSVVDRLYQSIAGHCGSNGFNDDVTIFAVGNALKECRCYRIDFSLHQLDKHISFIRSFLQNMGLPEQQSAELLRLISRLFFTMMSGAERKGWKAPLEVKLISKTGSMEIGFRNFDEKMPLEQLVDADCREQLVASMDEVRFSRLQKGSHLILIKKFRRQG